MRGSYVELTMNWRVSPHCRVVNLVRSGRKQPQLLTASAGGRTRLLFGVDVSYEMELVQGLSSGAIHKTKHLIRFNQA